MSFSGRLTATVCLLQDSVRRIFDARLNPHPLHLLCEYCETLHRQRMIMNCIPPFFLFFSLAISRSSSVVFTLSIFNVSSSPVGLGELCKLHCDLRGIYHRVWGCIRSCACHVPRRTSHSRRLRVLDVSKSSRY